MTQDITKKIKIINNMIFQINATINSHGISRFAVCPQCKELKLWVYIDNRIAKIQCSKCFWYEYYTRIVKNEK